MQLLRGEKVAETRSYGLPAHLIGLPIAILEGRYEAGGSAASSCAAVLTGVVVFGPPAADVPALIALLYTKLSSTFNPP